MAQGNEISQFEARAYKRLYEMYRSTLLTIINKARNSVEFNAEKPDAMKEVMSFIADESKWDYCGIEDNVTTKTIDELERCLGVY